jgi:hypothetical protein
LDSLNPTFCARSAMLILLATKVAAQGTCNLLGELYVTSPFDQTLTIKADSSADITTVQFSNLTQFVQVTVERKPAGEFDPKNLQVGDRLCVQLAAAQAKTAVRVLVMKRLEIQEHQKQVFSIWARNSALGVVTGLNPENQTIRLKEELASGASQQATVDASDPALFRSYSSQAQAGKDGVASTWSRLKIGDRIYVQGIRAPVSPKIRASVIFVGAVRGVVGTISSMNGLGEVIEVHELGSGNTRLIQTRRDAIFRASPFVEPVEAPAPAASSVPWDLYPVSFADLQKGDTISVLASEEESTEHTFTGLMVVTGFGSYGINTLPPPRHSGLLIHSNLPADDVASRSVAYRSIKIESTLTVFPLVSPVTTTANGDFWAVFPTISAALEFPAESRLKLNPSCPTTAKDFVFAPGEQRRSS